MLCLSAVDTYAGRHGLGGGEGCVRMSLLDTYRINKAIAVLLASQDAASAEALQAVATLKRLGPLTLPKLIAALGQVQNPQTMVALLVSLVQNATLPLF